MLVVVTSVCPMRRGSRAWVDATNDRGQRCWFVADSGLARGLQQELAQRRMAGAPPLVVEVPAAMVASLAN